MSVFSLLELLRDITTLTSEQIYIRQMPGRDSLCLDHNSMALTQVHVPIVPIVLLYSSFILPIMVRCLGSRSVPSCNFKKL